MTPIPRGSSLTEISEAVLERLDAAKGWQERFIEEQAALRPLPNVPFDARRVVTVRIRQSATVQLEGAWYSVPGRWAGLGATAYIGVEDVSIVCREGEITHPRQRFGARSIRYRHYLSELARKPQAVRQVAPELLAELGEPYGQFWALLLETYSELDAARILARVLGAICEHGEEAVQVALAKALTTRRADLLALTPGPEARPGHNAVPASLAGYEVAAGRAADYDHLLLAAAGA